jgi:DNA-binding MarR family transcriptional regulator
MMKHDPLAAASVAAGKLAECAREIHAELQTAAAIANKAEPVRSNILRFSPERQRHVRNLLKFRRARERFFGTDLFADPAWDILLELYAAGLAQQRVSVSAVCNAAAVPTTTALRWMRQLENKQMLVRTDDPRDARRIFVELSPGAFDMMEAYFDSAPDGPVS